MELSLPVRLVCLRTARKEAPDLCRAVSVERDSHSLTVASDAPAVSLQGDVLLLSKSCRVSSKMAPTVFTVELEGGVEVASAWTEPENVLESVP